jgi:dTDP-glucose 4,6-dehydratase
MIKIQKILVTGGAGFIGSNFIRNALAADQPWHIVNLDALTYAGNPENLSDLMQDKRYDFVHGDIRDSELLDNLFSTYEFDGVFHFAAESHVDRSIHNPEIFLDTNVIGTFRLLETSLKHWKKQGEPSGFRFLHVSTDEVYGSLGDQGAFTEATPYDPSSPYSASKASSDHIVRAYNRTYGLPTLITNCSNNYGPYQFPEKLIPLMIMNILEEKPLPIYGDGSNVRDWLYVADHCDALTAVFQKGIAGETYNVGGGVELQNLEIVNTICDHMDSRLGRTDSSRKLIRFVEDRLGHDQRYAIDSTKIESEIGWKAKFTLKEALSDTVDWYLDNQAWVKSVQNGEYRNWIEKNYRGRDGE